MVKFDFIADFYVIVIAPLLVAGVVVAVGFARAAGQPPEKRSKVAYVHGSLLLLGTFLVLPATSMKVREWCGFWLCDCIRALVTNLA